MRHLNAEYKQWKNPGVIVYEFLLPETYQAESVQDIFMDRQHIEYTDKRIHTFTIYDGAARILLPQAIYRKEASGQFLVDPKGSPVMLPIHLHPKRKFAVLPKNLDELERIVLCANQIPLSKEADFFLVSYRITGRKAESSGEKRTQLLLGLNPRILAR